MSLFEKNVSYSNAISILNDYRHYLKEPDFKITNKDKEIIIESLSVKDKDKFNSSVIYSFNLSNNMDKSAIIELSEAIFQCMDLLEVEQREKYINLIKDSLKDKKKIIGEDKDKIISLIIKGINFIFNQSKNCEESFGFEKMGL